MHSSKFSRITYLYGDCVYELVGTSAFDFKAALVLDLNFNSANAALFVSMCS